MLFVVDILFILASQTGSYAQYYDGDKKYILKYKVIKEKEKILSRGRHKNVLKLEFLYSFHMKISAGQPSCKY